MTAETGDPDTARLQDRVDQLEEKLHAVVAAYLELNLSLDLYLREANTDTTTIPSDNRTFREQLDQSWFKVYKAVTGENGC